MNNKNAIVSAVVAIDILATVFVMALKPQYEAKMFELYSVSVTGLWGAFAMQERTGESKDEK